MRGLLRRVFGRGESAGEEPETAAVLPIPQRSQYLSDIVIVNSIYAPAPWHTLPGSGYGFVRPWPLEDGACASSRYLVGGQERLVLPANDAA